SDERRDGGKIGARHTRVGHQAEPVHGHEDAVDSRESEPEVKFAERFIETARKDFWKPEKKSAENCKGSSDAHYQMEVAGDEIVADGTSGEVVAGEHNARHAARQKKGNKS